MEPCYICCLCPGLFTADPTCPWGLEVRWCRIKAQTLGAGEKSHSSELLWMLLQAPLNPPPVVPRKHFFIVCVSNPWSLRQPSIRSSCRRYFCSCTALSIYIEVALLFLLYFHSFFFRFWLASGSQGAIAWHRWPHLGEFPVYRTVPVLSCSVFKDLTHHWLPTLKDILLWRLVTQGGEEEKPTWWSDRSLPSMLWALP